MKKQAKPMRLTKETLYRLDGRGLSQAVGGNTRSDLCFTDTEEDTGAPPALQTTALMTDSGIHQDSWTITITITILT